MPADRLLIFSKVPEPGGVKTRLSPPLTPDEACVVYEASLRDVVTHAARERGRVEIWFAGHPDESVWFEDAFPRAVLENQCEGDLGARLENAFERSFADGAERVVIVGADVPTLPESTLTSAFRDLEEGGGVIGPSTDGGYVLIGLCRSAWPAAGALFRDVPWSTSGVLETSLQRAADGRVELRLLPGWYDIDRPEDLVRAAQDALPESHLAQWLKTDAGRAILGA